MPYFRTLGALPAKRRTLFPSNGNGFYNEELIGEEGFSSDLSHVYHRHPPSAIQSSERAVDTDPDAGEDNWPLLPRHFRTDELELSADLVAGRRGLLANADIRIGFAEATQPSELYRNANGDECLFIVSGTATLNSTFGALPVTAGDYVVIPAGVTHHWMPDSDGVRALVIESRGHIKPPRRYLSDTGQFLEMAPYRERDLKVPRELIAIEDIPIGVLVRRGATLSRLRYHHHPFDVVGWDGCLYPYALSIHDFEPIVGRIHQPPPVHQTFEGPGFVLCSFCPRPSDYDPYAVGGPANHANVDSDEVMFYAGGDYAARRGSGIDIGSISLHPAGWTHGPHQPPAPRAQPGAMLNELAVMIDTFAPLRITAAARSVEDSDYFTTWSAAPRAVDHG